MKIWEVEGTDDLHGVVFAQCSTKEKAEKALSILENNGFEGLLVKQSNLEMDQIVINNVPISL